MFAKHREMYLNVVFISLSGLILRVLLITSSIQNRA